MELMRFDLKPCHLCQFFIEVGYMGKFLINQKIKKIKKIKEFDSFDSLIN